MTTDNTTGGDPDAREAAIELLRTGELAPSDVAHLAGVDRQVVYYWAKAAKIDPAAAYQARAVRLWHRQMAKAKGKPAGMTKREMRAETAKAVAAFNAKKGARKRR